jgi:tetratricopeptide (TPR) repeat protein
VRDWKSTLRSATFRWSLLVFFLAAATTGALERQAEALIPHDRQLAELAYYPSDRWLKPMSLGESALLADLTWLRAVQYYGERRQIDNTFRLLYHAFDVVTNFDTRHRNSYVFGGTSLAQEGKDFPRGIELLEKGRRHDPHEWSYPFEMGFLYYVQRGDYLQSALYFQEAMRKPNCPMFVRRFAAFASQRAGSREGALRLWQVVAETSDNPTLKVKAVREALRLAEGLPVEGEVTAWARGHGVSPVQTAGGSS